MKKRGIVVALAGLLCLAGCARPLQDAAGPTAPEHTAALTALPTRAPSAPTGGAPAAPTPVPAPEKTPAAETACAVPTYPPPEETASAAPSLEPISVPEATPAPERSPELFQKVTPEPGIVGSLPPREPGPGPVPEPVPEALPEGTGWEMDFSPSQTPLADIPQAIPAEPEEQIAAAYRRAREAYGWFRGADLPMDREKKYTVDGVEYYRVSDPDLESLAQLRLYLKGSFSDEIVDELLPAEQVQFLEREDGLYCRPSGRTPAQIEEDYQILRAGESKLILLVNAARWEGEPARLGEWSSYELTYEKLGEEWLFTEFDALT